MDTNRERIPFRALGIGPIFFGRVEFMRIFNDFKDSVSGFRDEVAIKADKLTFR